MVTEIELFESPDLTSLDLLVWLDDGRSSQKKGELFARILFCAAADMQKR
jgi:predicted nucleotidyltransferase